MSQLLFNKMRMAAGVFAVVALFLVFGTVDAQAQQVTRAASGNPYELVAQKLGVPACQPGTATNIQGGLATLTAEAEAMKAQLKLGNTSSLMRVKYEYYTLTINDVEQYSVAVEFAALTNLTRASQIVGDESLTNQQLAAMYNGVRTAFGMCQ